MTCLCLCDCNDALCRQLISVKVYFPRRTQVFATNQNLECVLKGTKENLMYENHFHFKDKHKSKGIVFLVDIRDSETCCHGPFVNSVCVIIPTKQGCEGLTDCISDRGGFDALGMHLGWPS